MERQGQGGDGGRERWGRDRSISEGARHTPSPHHTSLSPHQPLTRVDDLLRVREAD